jgi:hypothetical protein
MEAAVFRIYIYIEMAAYISDVHLYLDIYICMYIYFYIYIHTCCRFKRKMEDQVIFINAFTPPFAHRANVSLSFVHLFTKNQTEGFTYIRSKDGRPNDKRSNDQRPKGKRSNDKRSNDKRSNDKRSNDKRSNDKRSKDKRSKNTEHRMTERRIGPNVENDQNF